MATAKKKEAPSKEVAKKEENALVDSSFDLGEMSGLGMEEMQADDLQIPRIGIIQSLSPQRSKTKPEYIEGATEGQVFNNVTKALMDGEKGIKVIPIKYKKSYIEWAPDRGGLVAIHEDKSALEGCTVNKKGQNINEEGNTISPTAEYFVFILDEKTGATSPAVISMASTALKQSKAWNTQMNQLEVINNGKPVNPPMFYGVYNLKTVPQSNDQGEWFRWEITAAGTVETLTKDGLDGKAIFDKAFEFYKSVNEGSVKVAEMNEDAAGGEESDEDPM